MKRERIRLEVEVDLDPVPGTFHTKESARDTTARILMEMIPHYHPAVSLTNYEVVTDDSPNPYAHPDCTCVARVNDPNVGHEATCDISTRRYKNPAAAMAARLRANQLADQRYRLAVQDLGD